MHTDSNGCIQIHKALSERRPAWRCRTQGRGHGGSSPIPVKYVSKLIREPRERLGNYVVVPRDQLDEVLVKGNTGLSIEDGRGGVAVEVRGDKLILGVSEDALELAVGGVADGLLDVLVRGTLLDAAGKVCLLYTSDAADEMD